MGMGSVWRRIVMFLTRPHRDVKSFEQEVEGAGISSRSEGGMKTIPTYKIVGSVGRAQNLRSDFFYRAGKAMTGRFVSIGKAMEAGKVLPPIEVYKARLRRKQGDQEKALTEYYVVDGHHRVAMARKLGQDYLDAHVVEYKVAGGAPPGGASAGGTPTAGAPAGTPIAGTPAEGPAGAPAAAPKE